MIKLNASSSLPVYQQIIQSVKHQVMTAKMHAGQQLPSVRKLAKELNINPNTVQKAYAILHRDGIIYSLKGKGDFVADNAALLKEMKRADVVEKLEAATREARDSGMWIDEIFTMVDEVYSRS